MELVDGLPVTRFIFQIEHKSKLYEKSETFLIKKEYSDFKRYHDILTRHYAKDQLMLELNVPKLTPEINEFGGMIP